MTRNLLQHNVAITSLRSAHTYAAKLAGSSTCRRIPRQASRRWQSSAAAKAVPLSSGTPSALSKYEIPSECFVDSPSFPEPSLRKSQGTREVDLSTTRPATLESPTPIGRADYPDGNIPLRDRVKYLYSLGKSFLVFYKTGLKNIWSNWKIYRAIRGRLQGNALSAVAKYGGQTIKGRAIPEISRSEYQLALRTRHDLFKMVPFSLVFVICGEFTPLVIIALGSAVVPYTCRIPRQEQKDVEKKLRQDKHYMEFLPHLHPDIDTAVESPDWRIEHLEAYRLGLTSIRAPIPVLGPIYHALLTRPRLIRHCDSLVADTLLIQREGGPRKLSYQDLYEWSDAYGLYAFHKYFQECQKLGKEPRSNDLKKALLPKVEAEMRYMLNQVADWSKLKPSEQWRIGLRTVGSKSPDWEARLADIRRNWNQG